MFAPAGHQRRWPLVLALLLAACSVEAAPELLAPPARDGWNPESAWPGFTLVSPLQSRRVYLVDMAGEVVHTWDTERSGGANYLTERGTLLRCLRLADHPIFSDAPGHSGQVQEVDWNGDVLWDFRWDGDESFSHHDIEELPNGNVLLIAWDRRTREAGLAAGRDPELLQGEEFWAESIYEIRPTPPSGGEVAWEWHVLDHVIQSRDENLPNFGLPRDHPERIDINGDRDPPAPEEAAEDELARMAAIGYVSDEGAPEESEPEEISPRQRARNADWLHINAIDYDPLSDRIALSVRRFDEIWILDHGTTTEEAAGPAGDLLYRWGNPFAYGMGRWEERSSFGQHDVQWIPEGTLGAGNLILFNNGAAPREYSSVDEFFPPRTAADDYWRAPGAPFGPDTTEWTYVADPPEDFYSSFISGVQRLPNGNTLICEGDDGRVFEVTPAQEIVWDWRSPFQPLADEKAQARPTSLFRARRYGPDHPGIVALRAKGAPVPEDPGTGPATNQYEPQSAADGETE